MGDRARRSRDGTSSCSRYSIDTLFPGLSKNQNSSTRRNPSPMDAMELDRERDEAAGLESIQSIRHNISGEDESDKYMEDGLDPDRKCVGSEQLCSSSGSSGSPQRKGSSAVGATKRKSGSPLKPTTQPKQQMYPPTGLTKLSRKEMFQVFQPWILSTYGDSAKTKTITKKKYNRIVKTLRGEEINNAENSKFRFWVKAKGFHIGPPSAGELYVKDELGTLQHPVPNEPDLYVPTTVKDGSGLEKPIFKRVAVVEYFFDIIYMVHVETEAKNGKHAGQKRTYRAITEKYAFLPREAVTKFLLQCTECQKRGSPGTESTSSGSGGSLSKICAVGRSPSPLSPITPPPPPPLTFYSGKSSSSEFDINFTLPFSTTPSHLTQDEFEERKQMRGRDGFKEDEHVDELFEIEKKGNNRMVKMSHSSSRKKAVPSKVKVKVRAPISRELHLTDPTSGDDEHDLRLKTSKGSSVSGRSKNGEGKDLKAAEVSGAMDWLGYQPLGLKKETTNNNIYSNGKHEFREQSSPLSIDRLAVNHETALDETSSNGNKDDEDDDDDESEDRMDTQQHDPERLKAFNMFVRLFVDENLDRMVPISKQPKEKIQAIIDSCTRQFPEFAERARKRIRTYLKSCRRNKRSREGGWESSRPTPAHLTSVQAETVLAQACENESQNAKRMRMGLEPVSCPLPMPLGESRGSKENGHHTSSSGESSPEKQSKVSHTSSNSSIAATIAMVASNCNATTANSLSPSSSSMTATVSNDQKMNLSLNCAASNGESLLNQLPSSAKGLERSPLVDYSRLNGNGAASMYRPNFNQTFQRPSPFPSLFPAVAASAVVGALGNSTFPSNVSPLPLANGDAGPTDLSMKSKPLLAQGTKLSTTDVTTVRQLITGYRESAAFLLRSADELEQLLIQQQ